MNVYEFAIQKEEESKAHYEKLAREAESVEVKNIFSLLADSEGEHIEHLKILKTTTDPEKAESAALEKAKKFIHDLVSSTESERVFATDSDGYRHAIEQEEVSIKFYENMAEKEPNAKVATLLRQLADDERHHMEMMENIYDFVESPRTYLAWGEFSNLRKF